MDEDQHTKYIRPGSESLSLLLPERIRSHLVPITLPHPPSYVAAHRCNWNVRSVSLVLTEEHVSSSATCITPRDIAESRHGYRATVMTERVSARRDKEQLLRSSMNSQTTHSKFTLIMTYSTVFCTRLSSGSLSSLRTSPILTFDLPKSPSSFLKLLVVSKP
jgi:hypothetical protein